MTMATKKRSTSIFKIEVTTPDDDIGELGIEVTQVEVKTSAPLKTASSLFP